MSNTSEAAAEPLCWREVERSEGVVDVAGVGARMRGRNGVGFAPERLGLEQPSPLVVGEGADLRQIGKHTR